MPSSLLARPATSLAKPKRPLVAACLQPPTAPILHRRPANAAALAKPPGAPSRLAPSHHAAALPLARPPADCPLRQGQLQGTGLSSPSSLPCNSLTPML